MAKLANLLDIVQSRYIGIKENDGLQASELGVVDLNLFVWLDELVHDPGPDVFHNVILK